MLDCLGQQRVAGVGIADRERVQDSRTLVAWEARIDDGPLRADDLADASGEIVGRRYSLRVAPLMGIPFPARRCCLAVRSRLLTVETGTP